jgi:hypothetical protein
MKDKVQVENRATLRQKVSVSETSVVCIDGWEDFTKGDKKLNAYTFTKNAGPQFHLPDAEPMDYFSLFFNDELLNNIVVETNRYERDKISELQLSPRSIWSRFQFLK